MKNNKQYELNSSTKWAYFQYLFNSFWRRPSGYIVSFIYLFTLATIFLIVPKAMNNSPLFVWNLSTFNIPILVLFFVAAICAIMAITIFRISQEDGTELSISAKPLTKISMVGFKVLVYLIVMLVITGLTVAIVALIRPIFGVYSETNTHGIKLVEYKGIMLSMLVGNLVNILLFSGLSILVSMVAGQVITMITSIGLAFVMVMLNFIYGYVVKTPADVITDTYQSTINSYSLYTRKQYENQEANPSPSLYASIQCYVNEEGEELNHFDTYQYWSKAESKSKSNVVAYLDFGKQLSSLLTSFGLEEAKQTDAEKMGIGYDIAYKYTIDPTSHVTNKENIEAGNYPVCSFAWEESQGKYYPVVVTLGHSINGINEWYLYSLVYGLDFNATSMIGSGQWTYTYPGKNIAKQLDLQTCRIEDLYLTPEQQTEAHDLYQAYVDGYNYHNGDYFLDILTTSSSGIWQGEYNDLSITEKFVVNSKLQLYFLMEGQLDEYDLLSSYLDKKYPEEPKHVFPFSTKQVVDAYINDNKFSQYCIMTQLAACGFNIGTIDGVKLYSILETSTTPYCESFSNLYTYKVIPLYSTTALTAIWSSIAVALFLIAIVVYKKKDFK